MTDLASRILAGRRRLVVAAALVGALLAGGTPAADAGTTRADLSRGPGAGGSDAEGRLQFKQKRRGERLKIRLDNLEPRTEYEVRDGATDEVLGTVRTDRRGRAKKTLRAARGETLSGAMLEICEPGSDDPILEGQVPDDGSGDKVPDGSYRIGTVSTDPDAAIQVSITLSSTSGYGGGWEDPSGGMPDNGIHKPMRDDGSNGGGEDRDYDSISLFAGPGGVWIAGEGEGGGDYELPSIPGPVTFWISDGEGLVKVAVIEKADWGEPIPLGMPSTIGDDGNVDGMIYPMPDSYSWYADNASEPGLPFGVGSVGDLSGRAFEVRDGEGAVLLEGVLPELEEIVYEPQPDPMPWPDLPCPFPGGDFNIIINIDLGGIDLGSIDWSQIDFGNFDLEGLLKGLGGNDLFDFSKLLGGLKF